MSEPNGELQTRSSLARDLVALGVSPGDTLLVHSSLSSLGWVCGGATAVVQALMDSVGRTGTVTVPTQTSENSDPAGWGNPPVPEAWWETIRAEMPGYDPRVAPTQQMGRIPELLRTWPGAVRSGHPQTSFAAVGARCAELMAPHPLASSVGHDSPLAHLEEADARVLLLGTGFDTCTCFHLAEYRVPDPPTANYSCAVLNEDGSRAWVTFTDVSLDESDFEQLGTAFDETGAVTTGQVGTATARLFSLRAAVEFATAWMGTNRRNGAVPRQ